MHLNPVLFMRTNQARQRVEQAAAVPAVACCLEAAISRVYALIGASATRAAGLQAKRHSTPRAKRISVPAQNRSAGYAHEPGAQSIPNTPGSAHRTGSRAENPEHREPMR